MEKQASHIRFCLYARKSSESDERQAISIGSQISEMKKVAQREGYKIKQIYQESKSAKQRGQRKLFNKLIEEIEQGKFNGIITWAADRLSRNAGDLGILVDLMDEGKLEMIATYSQTFTDNPNEKYLLMILGSQAKLENDNRSVNVKRGIRNQCELGYWPGKVPLGYVSETIGGIRKIYIDPERGEILKQVFEKVADGIPVKEVFHWIQNQTPLRTRNDRPVFKSTVYAMLRNKFYMGIFVIKGREYKGNYKPLISKELFQKVQSQLRPIRTHSKTGDQYSLVKYLKCSYCGSAVHRNSRYRKLKNGRSSFHVYYLCTKTNNENCPAKHISEEKVYWSIVDLLNYMDMNKIIFPDEIKKEIVKFECMKWNIYSQMKGSPMRILLHPVNFKDVDQKTIKMYLQNAIMFENNEKRFRLTSLLLCSNSHTRLIGHNVDKNKFPLLFRNFKS